MPFFDVDGKRLNQQTGSAPDREPVISMRWSELQRHLLEGLPSDVEVVTNSQLVELEYAVEDCELLCAQVIQNRRRNNTYANWEGDPAAEEGSAAAENSPTGESPDEGDPVSLSFLARLVVGADGINSRCREVVYRNIGGEEWVPMARAQYSGFVSFRGKGVLTSEEAENCAEAKSAFLSESIGCVVKPREEEALNPDSPSSLFCNVNAEMAKKWGWEWLFMLHVAVEECVARREVEAGGHAGLYERSLAILEENSFPQSMSNMGKVLLKAPEPHEQRSVIARPLYVVPVDEPPPFKRASTVGDLPDCPEGFYRPFGHRNMFLVGDALHGMPPFTAQGASMGFEDVVELVDLLAKACEWGLKPTSDTAKSVPTTESLEHVLSEYRKARIERVTKTQWCSLNRGVALKGRGWETFRNYICDFTPCADGYSYGGPAPST